jgi:hypothetical protein
VPLFSILITDDDARNSVLPDIVKENMGSFRELHPGHSHQLFSHDSAREFIAGNFDQEVVSAFDAMTPFAYKADLVRYCLLHRHGGLYSDLSYFFLKSVIRDPVRISVFRDFLGCSPWDTCLGVIAAPPEHKAFAKAIELVCANVKSKYYGPTPLCPTGPTLFGKAIALTCDPEDLIVGESVWLTLQLSNGKSQSRPSHGLFSNGELVAIKRKAGGGPLTEIGIRNGNEYNKLWQSRKVYSKPGFWKKLLRRH